MAAATEAPKMKPTLGLTGVAVNAMTLIAPRVSFLDIGCDPSRIKCIDSTWRCGPGSS
jgi:hypothetical protein